MATNTFRINYMNLSTGYYQDKMPIAVLPGNSKMPVLRDSGSYTMPVARITDGNKAQVMELQKLQTPAFKFPAQLVPVPQEK
ncbi:MAG TPA: hypothetical protein VHA56_08825 [Mucilaginibacter sp.]|nr:hypothetical protein [Mucilaginibacter sp.]